MSAKSDPNLSDSSEDDEDYVPQEVDDDEDEKDEELEFDDVDDDLLRTCNNKKREEKEEENSERKNPDEEKKRIDTLWEDFLDDSNKPSTMNNTTSNQTNLSEETDKEPTTNKKALKRTTLSQVANILSAKKKKLSVLDKTSNDWKAFVQKEGIQEDLKNHGRSKDAYIEKQEFLLKADYCEFEKEKALRNVERKK